MSLEFGWMLIVSNADPNHYPALGDANINSCRVIALNIMGFRLRFISCCILADFWLVAGRRQYWKELLGKEEPFAL
jgi:hypothetical protein